MRTLQLNVMKPHLNRLLLILNLVQFAALAFMPGAAAGAEQKTAEIIKEEFIQHIKTSVHSFEVCEVIDRDENKKQFLRKALQGKYQPGSEKVEYKEIFIKQASDTGHLHLGIIVLDYPNKETASAIYQKLSASDQPGYFANTKILTQYKTIQQNDEIIIIYSETFIKDLVKRFIDKFGG